MELTGAQALVKSLEMQGVEVIFGLPGGAILPVYDPIIDSPIRHILVRHEQGAGHMAEGYAQATGRPGVAMVTSGPGRDQRRDRARRCLHGLDPLRVHHRAGGDECNRDRRLPRERHDGHHAWRHQAQLARHGRRRHPPSRPRGVPHRHDGPARDRCSSTSRKTSPRRRWSGTGPTASTCPATTRLRSPTRRQSRPRSRL